MTSTRASISELDVGRRLRARRERDGLTLRELARRLEASPSALSQIENGKSLPSVSRLYAIASELGMSLDELFENDGSKPRSSTDANNGSTSSRGGRVQRAGTRRTVELGAGVRWERVTAEAEPNVDFVFVIYDVDGSSTQDDQFIRHSGSEHGLVLSGTLEVAVGFDSYVLGPGDSISFDSTLPHRLRNVGDEQVTAVWLNIGHPEDLRSERA